MAEDKQNKYRKNEHRKKKQSGMKHRKIYAGIAIAAAVAVGISAYLFSTPTHPDGDAASGRTELENLAAVDMNSVQTTIQTQKDNREAAIRAQQEAEAQALAEQQAAEAQALAEQQAAEQAAAEAAAAEAKAQALEVWREEANAMADADQFKEIFANSVIIGDSIVNGILQCDLMYPSSVVCEVGANIYDIEDKLGEVAALYPQKIFLYLGFNDIGICRGDYDFYYERYATFIQELEAAVPGVPIYINQLIPPISLDSLGHEEYLDVPSYNEILARICDEYGLTLIEDQDLIKEEYYYKDGYHQIYPFYPAWLRRMAETAGLM